MSETTTSDDMSGNTFRITTRTPFKLKRRPGIKSVVMASETAEGKLNGECMDKSSQIALFQGLARAHYWQRLLDTGEVRSGSEIAKLEGLDPSTVNELLRLTLLDPSLVMDILEGKQTQQISMMWFTRNALPNLWHEQLSRNPLSR
jgi:DNA-binding protein Fis